MAFIDLKLFFNFGPNPQLNKGICPMNTEKTIFDQLMDFLPPYEFDELPFVEAKYNGICHYMSMTSTAHSVVVVHLQL